IEFRRSEKVVVADHLWTRCLRNFHEVIKRDHLSCIRPHIKCRNVLRVRTILLGGLRKDSVRSVIKRKIVYIHGAKKDLKCVGNLTERNAEALYRVPINFNDELGIIRRETGKQPREFRIEI